MRLRPTAGIVREAIFNILASRVEGSRVLDLYAGTGALGIEALSRGANEAVFIDGEAASCQAIIQSLSHAGFSNSGVVLRGRLPAAISAAQGTFDIVFMDPPYQLETAEETLALAHGKLAPDGLVVYEHGSRYNPPERPAGLRLVERRVYGDSAVALYAAEEVE